ncbi:alpha-2-macroglobulin family protein [Maribacter sp. HTCC2170]|uniref:alpha-2-macroglobulin family protein n=1 Tax=Maribacter sp. (strain HTCC2170 / KCCM 42371) TaxID=313603 RepID=UPI00006BD271|nr:MG2 domain-containing protein [Maribacter sp. HTCC2170]EAR02984.1 putative outer membrane protein [Maribacter sp. HTCC2170]
MKITQILRISLLILFFIGCNSKKENDLNEYDDLSRYQKFVAEVSHGIVSVKSDVRVVLNQPVDSWNNGDELSNDLMSVSPKVEGKVIALNNRTIAFIPEEGFKQNTEYKFILALADIIKDLPKDLKTISFGVKTKKQQFNVYTDPLQSYTKDQQFVNGQLRSSDVMFLRTAKALIKASQSGKNLNIKFEEAVKEGTQFHFKIDSIQRFDDDSQLEIAWDGTKHGIESSGKNAIKIPGKNNFTVLEALVQNGEEQLVLVNFSDPIKKGQNFKGLVALEGADALKFSIDGNTLKVYPSDDIKGTAQLEVFEGIESVDGHKLRTKFEERIAFEQIKPEIRLLSNGTTLPSSSNLKINFETVNLKTINVSVLKIYDNNILQFLQNNNIDGNYNLRSVARPIAKKKLVLQNQLSNINGKWTAHALDLKSLITPDPGAIYRVEFDFKPEDSSYKCDATNFELFEEGENEFDEEQEDSSWDGVENYYNDYYYNYDWNERENPCNTSYYYDKKIGVNILSSDIGLTIKKGVNNSYFVAVNNILNTSPIAGAKVTFYNYQQQPMGNVVTNAEGTSIFDAEKLAYFAIAENNGQKTYLKLNDGNALSVSKFKVAGTQLQKGIKGFIFGERGVWRPGDKVYLSFMLNDNENKLPQNHPVKLELMDPYNKIVLRKVQRNSLNNFYQFDIKTDENAPTGNWLAKVTVGGASFTKTIRIETIKPNRLKIKTDFEDEVLSGTNPISGNLEVKWLHGAIAKNLKADITAKFNKKKTSFESFPGYVFDDPTRAFSSEELRVFDGKLNAEGKVGFTMNTQMMNKAPGMLDAAFITKVYENGGDFSTDVFVKPYSSFQTYIGLNTPKGDKNRGMLLTDTKHKFEIVSVDEKGKPRTAKKLKVTIHKVNWRWWWDTSADNLSNFSSSNYRERVFEKTISTNSSGKATFDFELKYPNWGRYLVRVEDKNGGHATGKTIYIDWPGWAGKSRKNDPSAATMLVFSSDKEKYNVNETAKVTFPSSEGGRALVTVENGNEVLESLWVETTKGETKFDLPIKDLYTPNVFIHITLLQPHATTLNDSPIRLYGVIPVSVENTNTKLNPIIAMPDVLRPEEKITVKVSEKRNKAMTYSIAIVDEGLLDLTRFNTPDPWNTFYAHEALGVKTWDVYDDVIGAFGGRINQVLSIGGDGELAGAKNKKANRFEPMVVHLGPFELKEGQTKSHEISIPKYVGSVRTMVVAGENNSEAYGKTEKTTPVRKPLMVLASLPRKITPGEMVTLPVTVFAMEKKVKNVTLKIKKDQAFTIEGDESQTLSFSQPDEKMAYFELKVADFNGIGKVIVEATGNGEKASFEIPIDVVNPNPMTSTVQDFVLDANGSETFDLETFGVAGSNSAQLEFSTLPPMNFNGRMKYLIRYPHGCVEQTTSAAFPQLFLADIFDLDANRKNKIQLHVENAIKRLGGYQLPNGGFSYWPGQGRVNDWGTSFAGHFLLEAEKKGYVLPIGFKSSWVSYQQQIAKQWRSGSDRSDLAQAYRLFALALSGNADVASMNRLRETRNLSNESKYRLAASYAMIGQAKVAKELLSNASLDFNNSRHNYYTYGSASRNRAMALETLVLMKDKSKAQEMAKTVAQRLSEKRWMSTQSTAYSLLAMAKFAEMVGGKGIKVKMNVNGNQSEFSTERTLAEKVLKVKKGTNSITLSNLEQNTLFVSVVNNGILPVGNEKTIQRNLLAKVVYKGRDGSQINESNIMQGTDFVAEVTLTNTSSNPLKDVALMEIFPSGWEIVNTRFTDFGDFAQNNVTHTDIRDYRANFYFDMKRNETKTFRILLNASYLGRYYLPGIQAEAMYDNDHEVRTKGKWVQVVR